MIVTHTIASYLRFIWAGLVKQGQTGGIVPSQRILIGNMIAPVPQDYRGQVLELGAGNGALTLRLAARCPQARILACEINPALAADVRGNVAAAGLGGRVRVVADSAENVLSNWSRNEAERPDFVISGIPLGNLPRDRVNSLLDKISAAIQDDGMYIQFQHSLIDRKKVRAHFPNLRTLPVLWNFPPAVIYYGRKAIPTKFHGEPV